MPASEIDPKIAEALQKTGQTSAEGAAGFQQFWFGGQDHIDKTLALPPDDPRRIEMEQAMERNRQISAILGIPG